MNHKILIAASLLLSTPVHAQASSWSTGAWSASPQQVGSCQIDEAGKAQRLDIRDVSCRSSDGSRLRDQDCDSTNKPESARWSACTMRWSCFEWHSGRFAEGPASGRSSYRPTRSSKIGASVACTNAVEANPDGVHSCRASLVDGEIQRLTAAPTGFVSNANYAWISCQKAAR